MPLPAGALPPVFTGPLNPTSDVCDAFTRLIGLRKQVGIWISWMFNDDGTLSDAYNAELTKWQYGPLTSSGTGSEYILTDVGAQPYRSIQTENKPGRVVFFIASHDSPAASTGSTVTLGTIATVPLLNLYGVALEEQDILNGQLVGAIYDGANYRIFTGISRISLDQLEGRVEGDFLRSRAIGGRQRVVSEGYYMTSDAALAICPAAPAVSPVTFAHGFPATPLTYGFDLVNIVTDQGYVAGDEVMLVSTSVHDTTGDDQVAATVWKNPSVIGMIRGNANCIDFRIAHKTTGAQTEIDPAKWKIRGWAIAA